MSISNLKNELADHIYQYLCHEAQYSDLSEAARESLTAASECIEQAYKLNINNNNSANKQQQQQHDSSILPDELLRIFTRHKEFLSQQKDSINYSMRNNESESSSMDKPDIRVSSHPLVGGNTSDSHNITNPNMSPSTSNNPNVQALGASITGHQQPQSQQPAAKQHSQHPISQLPMTTRKKLSHLRAQIKRQASKAARSRLEKRSSVSGATSGSGSSSFGGIGGGGGGGGPCAGGGQHLGGMLGTSLDAGCINSKLAGDGYNIKDGNQSNSLSSDSQNAYLNNPSTSSPAGPGSGQTESNINSSSSPGQHNDSGAGSSSGTKHSGNLIPGSHHHSIGVSVHQKNFKQKLIALIKKFRTDGSDFDSEEQYREALERELMKAAAGRGSKAIEELLEEEIDVEEESGSEPEDWDNISESSTPKPSLRPFFSSTTLDKI